MIEITSRVSPYKAVCYIESHFSDGYVSRASGSIVGSNDVLTAMHTVYDSAHGGWATQVMVTPGAFIDDHTYDFSAPFGTYSATNWIGYTSSQDPEGDHMLTLNEASMDLAIIGLNVNVGSLTGTLNTSFAKINDFQGSVLGYPAQGTGLMGDTGNASSIYNSLYKLDVYKLDVALGPGASGGPLLDYSGVAPVIRGVLSTGNDNYSNYAGLSGLAKQIWYNQTTASNDIYLSESSYRPIGQGITSGSDNNEIFYELRLSLDSNGNSAIYGYKGGDILELDFGFNYYKTYLDISDKNTFHVYNNVYGTDIALHDVNVLKFTDKTLFLLNESQAKIARLYSTLDHAPDVDGLQFWLQSNANGVSYNAIASSFLQSSGLNSLNNVGFVNNLYTTIFKYTGDTDGIAYWNSALNSGLSRTEMLTYFTETQVNHQNTEGANGFIQIVGSSAWTSSDFVIGKGSLFASDKNDYIYQSQISVDSNKSSAIFGYKGIDTLVLTNNSQNYKVYSDISDKKLLHVLDTASNENYLLHDMNVLKFQDKNVFLLDESQAKIARLYSTLDHAPDVDGLQFWLQSNANGVSYNAIASSFLQSSGLNSLNNVGFVNNLYTTIFKYTGDTDGIAYWNSALNSGLSRTEMLTYFTETQVNHQNTEGANGFIQIVGSSDWA